MERLLDSICMATLARRLPCKWRITTMVEQQENGGK
jgi:hypothetical protein